MKKRKIFYKIDWVSTVLVLVGAINWGLVGVAKYNLVQQLFGFGAFTNVIYSLVGLSGLWILYRAFNKKFMKK